MRVERRRFIAASAAAGAGAWLHALDRAVEAALGPLDLFFYARDVETEQV